MNVCAQKSEGGAVTALLLAIRCGRDEEVERLLAAGVDVNLADADGLTPLMASAMDGYVMIARLLLGAGADPRVRSKWGMTALAIADCFGHSALVALLEERTRDAGALKGLQSSAKDSYDNSTQGKSSNKRDGSSSSHSEGGGPYPSQ